jgi:hypothetical protein
MQSFFGIYRIVIVPKSGKPVLGQIDEYSGNRVVITYPGNWFGQVSSGGSLDFTPARACSSVYLAIILCQPSPITIVPCPPQHIPLPAEVTWPILSQVVLYANLPITCPICDSAKIRRSKRRSIMDYLFSGAEILPWRCEACESRFHARPVPFRFSLYAHCRYCGNADLRRTAPESVLGWTAFWGRFLRLPSLRCDPCRHRFFSLRPLMPQDHLSVPTVK